MQNEMDVLTEAVERINKKAAVPDWMIEAGVLLVSSLPIVLQIADKWISGKLDQKDAHQLWDKLGDPTQVDAMIRLLNMFEKGSPAPADTKSHNLIKGLLDKNVIEVSDGMMRLTGVGKKLLQLLLDEKSGKIKRELKIEVLNPGDPGYEKGDMAKDVTPGRPKPEWNEGWGNPKQ